MGFLWWQVKAWKPVSIREVRSSNRILYLKVPHYLQPGYFPDLTFLCVGCFGNRGLFMAFPCCRSVFITGCNRGLGLEFVKQFLSLPTPPEFLFATCRSLEAESANELKQLASKNKKLHLLQLDVEDYEGIKRVATEVSDRLAGKGLNLLLNNAGVMSREVIGEITPEEMMRVYKINAVSPIMVAQGLLPLLKTAAQDHEDGSSPKAAIVNVTTGYASSAYRLARIPYPYSASKAALNLLTRAMDVDLESFGISVFACDPGWVQTDMGSGAGKAPLTPEQSVSGLMKAFGSLDENAKKGVSKYDGQIYPW